MSGEVRHGMAGRIDLCIDNVPGAVLAYLQTAFDGFEAHGSPDWSTLIVEVHRSETPLHLMVRTRVLVQP